MHYQWKYMHTFRCDDFRQQLLCYSALNFHTKCQDNKFFPHPGYLNFFRHFYVEILANFFFLIRSFYSVDKVFAFNVLTWWSYSFFRLPVGCFEIALVDKLIYYKWNFSLFSSNRYLETTNCVTFLFLALSPLLVRVYVSIQSICFIKVTTDDGSINAGECLESGNGDIANRDRWRDR